MPLLILTLTAALGPIALGPASDMLGGLFKSGGRCWGLTLVALVAGLIGCTAVAQINLVMYYGRLRLGDPAYGFLNPRSASILAVRDRYCSSASADGMRSCDQRKH
jgi:hypothetical protein